MATWKKVLASASSASITVPDDTGTIALTGTSTQQTFSGPLQASVLCAGAGSGSMCMQATNGGELAWDGTFGDTFFTYLRAEDPTNVANVITLPDDTGTVALTGTATQQVFNDVSLDDTTIGINNSSSTNYEGMHVYKLSGPGHNISTGLSFNYNDGAYGEETFGNIGIYAPHQADVGNYTLYLPEGAGTLARLEDIAAPNIDGTTQEEFEFNSDSSGSAFYIHNEDGVGTAGTKYKLKMPAAGVSTHVDVRLPASAGTIALTSQLSGTFGGFPIIYEGTSFDTTIEVTEPTDTHTITFPDDGGVVALAATGTTQVFNGVVRVGRLDVGAPAGARSISIDNTGQGEIKWEGVTINAYKTILDVIEPTAAGSDINTIALPDASGTVALAENVLALSGGTMTGVIDMAEYQISNAGYIGLADQSAHTANLSAGQARLYLNAANNLMFKNVNDGAGGGLPLMTALEVDTSPKLSSTLDLDGQDITNIANSTMSWQGESNSDKTFKIAMSNNSNGDGIIELEAAFIFTGELASAGSSSFVENDDTMSTNSDVRIATQQSIKAYVDKHAQFVYKESGFSYNSPAGTKVYIPIGASQSESSSFSGYLEKLGWVAPHDGSLELVQLRSMAAGDTVIIGLHVAGDGTTLSATPDVAVTTECSTADTTYDFDFSNLFGKSFSKGDMLMFSCEPETVTIDTNITLKLKLDVTT